MENGTTSPASLEAKIKTTSLPFLGDDFRSLETESKICNIAYDNILAYIFLLVSNAWRRKKNSESQC